MSARLVTVSLTPNPGLACWLLLALATGSRGREGLESSFSACRPLALRRDWRPVSRSDPSEAGRDNQRETAAVQTQSDELAVYDDEGVFL